MRTLFMGKKNRVYWIILDAWHGSSTIDTPIVFYA